MSELVTISERNGRSAVSARELHQVLQSKRQFGNWIQDRINKYGFIEGQDFEVFNDFVKNPDGGRPQKEYALSLDMAKEIAMVEGNERGRMVRRYFIDAERRLRSMSQPSYMIADPVERAQQWILEEQERRKAAALAEEQGRRLAVMEAEHERLEKKAEYLDRILQSQSLLNMTQIAQDYGMTAKEMNQTLWEMGIQYRHSGQWILYAPYLRKGYVHSHSVEIRHHDGRRSVKMSTKWTQKGRLFLYGRLKKEGILPVIEQDPLPTSPSMGRG